ncbi:fimbria/pilus outer membrane usher protein [Lysobacter yangpyeongensis]|uniref:Fimbria/pilus outer membrane usher protein n=1 Tax=Lysobacter yangpyeongensis TaxID=346182 RepID=A0ABW0SP49_9GAMM
MASRFRLPSVVRPRSLTLALAIALSSYVTTASAGAGAGTGTGSVSLGELGLPDIGGVAAATGAGDTQLLYLEAYLGERPLGQLARVQLREGRLFITPDDLRRLGVVVDPALPTDESGLIALDAVTGLSYRYDVEGQRLILDVAPQLRPNQSLGYRIPEAVEATRSAGLLLDYDAYGRSTDHEDTLSLGTMLRAFGRFGAIDNSFVSRAGDRADAYQRLDTRWTYSDSRHMTTWSAGDFIGGGLAWSRPVRMGGVQLRRNFGVRPDLITFPVPRFTGQATVPSSVELLVDNVKQFGADIDDGPFVLDSFPRITGAGEATLVVRDALGRTTQTSVPIYVDYQRLAPGLSDFSLEAGRLRLGYATDHDRYGDDVVASGSYRRGLSMSVTGEAHAEYGPDLRLAGAGVVWAPAGHLGVVTASLARSEGNGSGDQRSAGYQWMSPRFGFDLKAQRRSRGFRDLGDLAEGGVPTSLRAQDQASAWWAMPRGSLAFSWLRWRSHAGDEDSVRTLTWSQVIGHRLNASLGVFDSDSSGAGFNLNFNLPLGRLRDASLSASHSRDRDDAIAAVRQSPGYDGGWGWELQAGDRDGRYGLASTTLRGRYGEATLGADHDRGDTNYFGQASGSLVWMGGATFASRRIGDSFAVVSTQGVPGVPVLYENRLFGTTNARGFVLLPDLRGWQRNRVGMDPDALGVEYRVPPLEQMVTPADHGGVLVRFDVARVHPAMVTLLTAGGAPMPAGTQGRIVDGDAFLVGLDGQAYLADLPAGGTLEVELPGSTCRYALPAQLPGDTGVLQLGPLPCGALP